MCVQDNSFGAPLVWLMEGLGSGAGKILSHTAAGMSLGEKEQSLGVSDMKSAKPRGAE